MVQVLVQLDEAMARRLDKVAPGSSRQRSRFIRLAIQKALMDLQEGATREAYRRQPDDDLAYFNPRVWEQKKTRRRS